MAAQRNDGGKEKEQEDEPSATRAAERAANRQRHEKEAAIDAEEEGRAHARIQPPCPVPHDPVDGDVPENVGVDELRELRPRHAPGADEIELEWPRAR